MNVLMVIGLFLSPLVQCQVMPPSGGGLASLMGMMSPGTAGMAPGVMSMLKPGPVDLSQMEDVILMAHHKARSSIPRLYSVIPSDMNMLSYSPALALDAQTYASMCNNNLHDPRFMTKGLTTGWTTLMTLPQMQVSQVLDKCYQQHQDWTYLDRRCDDSCCYTQMVWAGASLVGCAANMCPILLNGRSQVRNAFFMACVYDRKAIPTGVQPFNRGFMPCSACPASKRECVAGMCASVTQKAQSGQIEQVLGVLGGNPMGALAGAMGAMSGTAMGGTAMGGTAMGGAPMGGANPMLSALGGGSGGMASMMNSIMSSMGNPAMSNMMTSMLGGTGANSMLGNPFDSMMGQTGGSVPSTGQVPAPAPAPVPAPAPAPSQPVKPCTNELPDAVCSMSNSYCNNPKLNKMCQVTCNTCPQVATTTTTPPAAVAPPCTDEGNAGYCTQVLERKLCNNATYTPHCKKTCKVCDTVPGSSNPLCKDDYPMSCKEMLKVAANSCEQGPFSSLCKKSCRMC